MFCNQRKRIIIIFFSLTVQLRVLKRRYEVITVMIVMWLGDLYINFLCSTLTYQINIFTYISIECHLAFLNLWILFLIYFCRLPCKGCKDPSRGGCCFYWRDSASYIDDMGMYWSHSNMLGIRCCWMQSQWTGRMPIFFPLRGHLYSWRPRSSFGWRKCIWMHQLFCLLKFFTFPISTDKLDPWFT